MGGPSRALWLLVLLLVLLPTTLGRFLLDLAGGLILGFFALSLVLAGLVWVGWRFLQSRMVTCSACGLSTFASTDLCPMCGAELRNLKDDVDKTVSSPASEVIIDVSAESTD